MTTWALIAIKPRVQCKTRLASILKPEQREQLARRLLSHALAAVRATASIDRIALVSRERDEVADDVVLLEDRGSNLNESLEAGVEQALAAGASTVMILPADLPHLTSQDVTQLLASARANGWAIAPDRHEHGTNALCFDVRYRIPLQFGERSFAEHCTRVRALGIEPACVHTAGLGLDLDTVADWHWFEQHDPAAAQALVQPRTHEVDLDTLLATPLDELMTEAQRLTLAGHGRLVSYSRKVFIPLTQLCRDVCHYCTFAKAPRSLTSAYLSIDEVLAIARAGVAAGCKEALFTLGDQPEKRHTVARRWLDEHGFATTLDYVAFAARQVYEETGLLPHLNPGVMTAEDIARLRKVSVSMGVMLETSSERLSQRGGPHFGSPDKHPAVRLATLRAAGEQAVPFTTGLLIGIGETRRERLESLLAIRASHERYGHIQEIIIQNFRAKADTKMADAEDPSLEEHLWTIAAARVLFGPEMTLQAPPNLRPGALAALTRAGINDWGGVSPVTPDHVNPEAPWPHLDRLRVETSAANRELVERLAIGPRFALDVDRWVDSSLRGAVRRRSDAAGLAYVDEWFAGRGDGVPEQADHWLTPVPTTGISSLSSVRVLHRAMRGDGLNEQEIVSLFAARGEELNAVLTAADKLRHDVNGDVVSYVVNRNINYTNICTFKCGFCAFSKGRSSRDLRGPAYNLDLEEIARRTIEARTTGATEVCLQGGIHPSYTGETYLTIVRAVKDAVPDMHVHAFSPLEVTHGAATLGLSLRDYLSRLKDAGLASLPGTAAEILDDEVRARICADKINTQQWLEVMRAAHSVGLRSTATIMFGHADEYRHWARHLLAIRTLQQETNGFTEFVPLPFVHMEAPMWRKGLARSGPTFREAVLMHAIARLVLHPVIANVQVSWVKMGPEGAAFCLQAGANDVGGTLMNESITRAAGGVNGQEMDALRMQTLIHSLRRVPRQRTTFYGEPPAAASSGGAQVS